MNSANIKQGDIVKCNVRGDEFFATVAQPVGYNAGLEKRCLEVESLTQRPIPTRFITPRQITDHWRKSRRS